MIDLKHPLAVLAQRMPWAQIEKALLPCFDPKNREGNRLDRCWLKGQLGDALHALLCATGYNIRWLMRAMARLGLRALLLRSEFMRLVATLWHRKSDALPIPFTIQLPLSWTGGAR